MQYIPLTDHNHAANPYELISIEFESKIIKRTLYDEIHAQLRDLIANFHINPREEYFKRVRTLLTFFNKFLRIIILCVHNPSKLHTKG
jgi:hypothetical protein